MINELKVSTLISDPYNQSILKKISITNFRADRNMEMSQEVEVVCYQNNNGEAGLPMLQVIDNDANLTDEQKRAQRRIYQTQQYTSSTHGFMVDPQTGQAVEAVEGNYPEGSISELEYWQQIPAAFFTEASLSALYPNVEWFEGTTLAELVYNAWILSAMKMIERNRI